MREQINIEININSHVAGSSGKWGGSLAGSGAEGGSGSTGVEGGV